MKVFLVFGEPLTGILFFVLMAMHHFYTFA